MSGSDEVVKTRNPHARNMHGSVAEASVHGKELHAVDSG